MLLVAAIATMIALSETRVVFEFLLYAWDALGAAFGPALILTLLWNRTTGWGVLAGLVTGVSTAIIWHETLHSRLYSLIPAFGIALMSAIIVSLLTPARASGASGGC